MSPKNLFRNFIYYLIYHTATQGASFRVHLHKNKHIIAVCIHIEVYIAGIEAGKDIQKS